MILAVLPFEGALRIAVFAAIFAILACALLWYLLKRYKNFKHSKLFVKNPNLSLLLFAVENLYKTHLSSLRRLKILKRRGARLCKRDCTAGLFMRAHSLRAKYETLILATKQIRAPAEKMRAANAEAKTKRAGAFA